MPWALPLSDRAAGTTCWAVRQWWLCGMPTRGAMRVLGSAGVWLLGHPPVLRLGAHSAGASPALGHQVAPDLHGLWPWAPVSRQAQGQRPPGRGRSSHTAPTAGLRARTGTCAGFSSELVPVPGASSFSLARTVWEAESGRGQGLVLCSHSCGPQPSHAHLPQGELSSLGSVHSSQEGGTRPARPCLSPTLTVTSALGDKAVNV